MLMHVSALNCIVNYLCSYVHEVGSYTSICDSCVCNNITLHIQCNLLASYLATAISCDLITSFLCNSNLENTLVMAVNKLIINLTITSSPHLLFSHHLPNVLFGLPHNNITLHHLHLNGYTKLY